MFLNSRFKSAYGEQSNNFNWIFTTLCHLHSTLKILLGHKDLHIQNNYDSFSKYNNIYNLKPHTPIHSTLKPLTKYKISKRKHLLGAVKVMDMSPSWPGSKGGHTTFFEDGFSFQPAGEPRNRTWLHLHRVVLIWNIKHE